MQDAVRLSRWLLVLLAAVTGFAPHAGADEASRYIVFDVVIDAPAQLQQAIERALDIRSWRRFEYVTPELLDQLVEAAQKQTRNVLETEGYFSADVQTGIDTSVEPRRVRISVEPGEPARIESVVVEFTGAATTDPALASRLEQVRAAWLLPRGTQFRQEDWTRAKTAIVADLASVSFAAAHMTDSLARVEADLRNVNLRVVVDSGPPFYFGTISVSGLRRHEPELVENFAPFAAGTPYSLELLRRYERRLTVTGYFSSVRATLDTDVTVADRAPVTVGVIEALPRRVDATVGFSTDTRARLGIAYTDTDFLDRALRLRTDLRVESLRQGLTAGIERPPGRSGWIDAFTGAVLQTDIQDLRTNETTLAVQRRRLDERNEPAFGIEWTAEQQDLRGTPNTNAYATVLGYQHTWRALDDLLSPTQGWMLRLNAGVALPAISSREFGQLLASGTYYHALSPRDHLRFRADAGWIVADSSEDIPQHFLFRTGGDTSVRGYEFQSLGVEVGSAVVGGRYLGIGSAEYTRWVGESWGIAGFVDAGNATDDLDDFALAVGYGLGLRLRSPVGAFRFDLAYGQETSSVRLHFSLGVRF